MSQSQSLSLLLWQSPTGASHRLSAKSFHTVSMRVLIAFCPLRHKAHACRHSFACAQYRFVYALCLPLWQGVYGRCCGWPCSRCMQPFEHKQCSRRTKDAVLPWSEQAVSATVTPLSRNSAPPYCQHVGDKVHACCRSLARAQLFGVHLSFNRMWVTRLCLELGCDNKQNRIWDCQCRTFSALLFLNMQRCSLRSSVPNPVGEEDIAPPELALPF